MSESNFERLVTVVLSNPDFAEELKQIITKIKTNDATGQQDFREKLKTITNGEWSDSEVAMIIEAIQNIDLEPICRAATVFGDDRGGN
jgi:hypothetical protein